MRVITGTARGRRLETLPGEHTRPTAERVKEALFSIIQFELEGRQVLDLFAGTGNLGIEALSRGAETCVFADSSRESLRLIRENIAHCKAEEGARVEAGDYRKILGNQTEPFDIILLDPPYNKGLLDECFRLIAENELLTEDGVIVAEHRREEKMPEELHGFQKQKERRYGIVMLSIYANG